MGVEEGWSSPALHAQLVRDSSRTRPAMSSQLPRRRRWGGITAHLRIPIRPRTAINDPLSNCVVDVVPDEPSCLHAWRSPSRRLMKRTGSAKASSGDSNQTTRRTTGSISALSGIGFIGSAPGPDRFDEVQGRCPAVGRDLLHGPRGPDDPVRHALGGRGSHRRRTTAP